jgi:hypothetical protein
MMRILALIVDDDSFHYFTDQAGMDPVVFGADLNLKHGPVSARGEAGREVLHGEADGSITATGDATGRAYVELTGYGY